MRPEDLAVAIPRKAVKFAAGMKATTLQAFKPSGYGYVVVADHRPSVPSSQEPTT